jgi:hypothetical protein
VTDLDENLYWAAGYFDARGGVYITKTQAKVIITDKDEEVLARFARIVGLESMPLARPPISKKSDARRTNKLEIGSQAQVERVLKLLYPLVTRESLREDTFAALKWISQR